MNDERWEEHATAPLAAAEIPQDAVFTLEQLAQLHAQLPQSQESDELALAEALAVEELEAELQGLELNDLDEALHLEPFGILDEDIPLEELEVAEIEDFALVNTPMLDDYVLSDEASLALQPDFHSPGYLSDAPLEVSASAAHLRPLLNLPLGSEVYNLGNHDDLAAFAHQAQAVFGHALQPLMDRLHQLWESEAEMAQLYEQLERLSRERGPIEQIMGMAEKISQAQAEAANQRPASAEVSNALEQVARLKTVLERYEQILTVLVP